jgi:hypothetical protein
MRSQLTTFLAEARAHRPSGHKRLQVDLENEMVRERLRGLGYIE